MVVDLCTSLALTNNRYVCTGQSCLLVIEISIKEVTTIPALVVIEGSGILIESRPNVVVALKLVLTIWHEDIEACKTSGVIGSSDAF